MDYKRTLTRRKFFLYLEDAIVMKGCKENSQSSINNLLLFYFPSEARVPKKRKISKLFFDQNSFPFLHAANIVVQVVQNEDQATAPSIEYFFLIFDSIYVSAYHLRMDFLYLSLTFNCTWHEHLCSGS